MIRAAVFDGPGRPFRFECVAPPKLGPGEALVRVSLCTVCGSDLHTFSGRRSGPTPCVLGHEAVGVIEEVSGELRDTEGQAVSVGDRVVWAIPVSCGKCFFCAHDLPQKCERLRKYGHEPHGPGTGPVGGLATHCHLLAGTAVVKVPDGYDLPDAVVGPAACATATATAAYSLAATRGGVCVVLGLGMLGLTACALASADGQTVIACDIDDSRLSLAKRFGAASTAKPGELAELARSLTAGRGADFALEVSGSPAAAALSLDVLRVGGLAVWVGAVFPTAAVPVHPETVVRKCLKLVGVHNYAPPHLLQAVSFLARNHTHFPFAELVAETFPLDDATAAFAFAEARRPVRVAIRCG